MSGESTIITVLACDYPQRPINNTMCDDKTWAEWIWTQNDSLMYTHAALLSCSPCWPAGYSYIASLAILENYAIQQIFISELIL